LERVQSGVGRAHEAARRSTLALVDARGGELRQNGLVSRFGGRAIERAGIHGPDFHVEIEAILERTADP